MNEQKVTKNQILCYACSAMTNLTRRIFSSVTIIASLASFLAADAALAATKKPAVKKKAKVTASWLYNSRRTYKDEKVAVENPTSRCNTPAMRQMHAKTVAQAIKEGDKLGITSTTVSALGDAYRDYLKKVDLLWAAMEEPYCGFGAFGTSAAKKSYEKGANRSHDVFLQAVKAIKQKEQIKK